MSNIDSARDIVAAYYDQAGRVPAITSPLADLSYPSGQSRQKLLQNSMRLLWANQGERAEELIFEYAQRGVPGQFVRWTGWAAGGAAYRDKLPALISGFAGLDGFHIFGGTQVYKLSDGSIMPTVCDVPIMLRSVNEDSILVGVIPKVTNTPHYNRQVGLILNINPEKDRYTIISDSLSIAVVMQPGVNDHYEWIDEIIESHRQSCELMKRGWPGVLVVFGGTPTAEGVVKLRNVDQEVVWWAKSAEQNPEWKLNILLIKGSGGVADKYASDPTWLSANRCAKVVECEPGAIRTALKQIKGLAINEK